MKFRSIKVVRDGLSAKVVAAVAAALVADAAAVLAVHGVKLGPEVEGSIIVLATAIITALVGYLVPEASSEAPPAERAKQ